MREFSHCKNCRIILHNDRQKSNVIGPGAERGGLIMHIEYSNCYVKKGISHECYNDTYPYYADFVSD